MSSPAPSLGGHDGDRPRPGAVAWMFIAAGWVLMGWVVAGVLREADRTHPGSWASWVVGVALVHDLVVLPLVLLVGLGFSGALAPAWRGAVRAAVTIVAVIGLATFPTIARFGARSDNPTILPLPAGRNLAVVGAVLLLVACVVGWIAARRGRSSL